MKQRILTLYHIFNMKIPSIALTVGVSQHFVKTTIDDYAKPLLKEDNFIIVESKMNILE